MKPLSFITFFVSLLLLVPTAGFSQATPKSVDKSIVQQDALITSKKWVCLNVSRKKLSRQDFKFEMGNELSLSIDKKYSFKNNDYNYQSGTWKVDGKFLYFFYNAMDGSNRTNTAKYKIRTLNSTTLLLKRTDKPRGKLTFK